MTTTPLPRALSTDNTRLPVGDSNPHSVSSCKGPKKPLQLLDLPNDVQRLILGHLLLKGTPIRLEPGFGGVKPVYGLSSAILQVNRYLHDEGCSVLYGLNVFEIEPRMSLELPTAVLPCIKRMFKLRYKVLPDSLLWCFRDQLEQGGSTSQRWLDDSGARSIRRLGRHSVGLHSLEIDVTLPSHSPTRSSNIVKELRNLQLPVLQSIKIIGIDDEDLVRSIKEDLEVKAKPLANSAYTIFPQNTTPPPVQDLLEHHSYGCTSNEPPIAFSHQSSTASDTSEGSSPSSDKGQSFRAQAEIRPPSGEEELLLLRQQIELQQKALVLQWQKLEAEKKLITLRSSSDELSNKRKRCSSDEPNKRRKWSD